MNQFDWSENKLVKINKLYCSSHRYIIYWPTKQYKYWKKKVKNYLWYVYDKLEYITQVVFKKGTLNQVSIVQLPGITAINNNTNYCERRFL